MDSEHSGQNHSKMIISATLSVLHFFVNIFAGGRSSVKIILFFLFFAVVAGIFFEKKNFLKLNGKKVNNLFWISIGILYSYSLFLYLYFFYRVALPLREYVLVMANGEISSSVWYHSHVMKGVVGIILHYFGVNTLENIDAGGAYLGFINNWFFIFGFIALCLALISTFLYLFYLKSKIQDKTIHQKIILSVIYAIGLFSFLKTAIDGGIFHSDAIVSLAVILFTNYILSSSREIGRLLSKRRILLFILALTAFSYIFILGGFQYQVLTSYLYILLISGLILSYLKMYEAKYVLALFLIFAFFASGLDRDIFSYERLLIKKDTPVYVFSYQPPSGIFKITKEVVIGKGVLYTVISERDSNVEELIENIRTIANLSPVSIPWQTCFPVGGKDSFSFNIHTKNILPKNLF